MCKAPPPASLTTCIALLVCAFAWPLVSASPKTTSSLETSALSWRHTSVKTARVRRDARGAPESTAPNPNLQADEAIIDEPSSSGDELLTSSESIRADNSANSPEGTATGRDARCSKIAAGSRIGGQETNDCGKVIETAVFVDKSLDKRYAGTAETNKLVLTIMNQVQHLLRYSSMSVPITIKLVLIEHLSDTAYTPAPDTANGDIDEYLNNFCAWQHRRMRRDQRKLAWDHAVLLSGLDLYKASPGRNHTGVLGLAWVGGMCKGNYSCTINEASNLESAYVIAHELGHSLGIMHDGQRNNCDPNGFIMSERTGPGKVHWSQCSNNYLKAAVARRQLACLDAEQFAGHTDPLYDLSRLKAPGQIYSINEQCKLAFGSNYTSFITRQAPFNNVCRELWCVAGTWAKAAHPALEGSSCGGGAAADSTLVCKEGKCA